MSSLLVLNRVNRLEIQSVMFVFSTQVCGFVNYCITPLTFSLVHLPHPSTPSQSQSTVYRNIVWLGGGGGVELCCRPYSAGV
jgi:hypothetical protein